jgi:hypothetical protein
MNSRGDDDEDKTAVATAVATAAASCHEQMEDFNVHVERA